jgi:ubiquitin-protein ligase
MAAVMGAASASDTGNACKRLQKELMAPMMNTDDGISAFPDSDNMLNW